jgi:hypothetical protein
MAADCARLLRVDGVGRPVDDFLLPLIFRSGRQSLPLAYIRVLEDPGFKRRNRRAEQRESIGGSRARRFGSRELTREAASFCFKALLSRGRAEKAKNARTRIGAHDERGALFMDAVTAFAATPGSKLPAVTGPLRVAPGAACRSPCGPLSGPRARSVA